MIPDVSIIVPCYNVAAYVDSCLESLVRQTLRNIEIICINDGSTDETWTHLLRWKEKDSRIILLNQRNAGVSAARNKDGNIGDHRGGNVCSGFTIRGQ